MEAGLLASRFLLAAVFGLAGLTKLRDRGGTNAALRAFGITERWARPLSVVLPVAELAIAAALVPSATAGGAAAAAALLTAGFIVVLVRTISHGERPDCRCFGPLTAAPVGWKTVARDGVLLALAAFVLAGSVNGTTPSATAWLGDLTAAEGLGLAVGLAALGGITFGGWVVLALLRQQGRLLARIEALEQNQAQAHEPAIPKIPVAEDFSITDADGHTVSLAGLRARGNPVVLVFTNPDCAACAQLRPDVARWEQDDNDKITVAVLSRHTEIEAAFGVDAAPSAVIITPTGLIASPVVAGVDAIRSLVAHLLSVVALQGVGARGNGHGHGHGHGGSDG